MSEASAGRRMTPEEFFEWQAEQDRNYELVDGVPVLPGKEVLGASPPRHARGQYPVRPGCSAPRQAGPTSHGLDRRPQS